MPTTAILLKERNNKITPNDVLQYDRPVPHSAIITEASSCTTWQLTQTPIAGQHPQSKRP